MTQNLRVEILYHKIPTDFEMEFQLSGCCRMRLSTEKTGTKSEFLKALAAAVSRSRIIITAGSLFSDEGLIRTVASAINKKTVFADASEYGMSGDEKIEIIDGSVPLITTDGLFGGCIIESGPQSIILLTDNKPIRKSVMKSLIHPYVTEISAIPEEAYSDTLSDEEIESEIQQTETELCEEVSVGEEETEEQPAEEENVQQTEETVKEDENPENTEPEDQPFELEMFVEPGFENKKFKGGYYGQNPDEYYDMGLYFGDGLREEKPPKADKATVFLAIFCVICFLCAASLIYMLVIHPLINGEPIGKYVTELFELTSDASNL